MPVVTPSAASIDIGGVLEMRIADHQRQAQLPATLLGQRQADQPTAVARHEVDVFRAHMLGRHDQIAFILTILIVHDDDHASRTQIRKNALDRVQRHDAPIIRSR
jgi:hypothetical protein